MFEESALETPQPHRTRPVNSMDPKTHKRDPECAKPTSSPLELSASPKKLSILNTDFKNRIESIFAWNLNALSEFYLSPTWTESMNVFFPPIIQGHVDLIKVKDLMTVLLISRRSYIMGGTRYNSRGINPSGFVGNYVETEQIMDRGGKVYSYIQIRGSVPFFWNQKNVGREVVIDQNKEINRAIMMKHFQLLNDRFSFKNVVILNLLSKWKKNEVRLGKFLHELYLDNFSDKKEILPSPAENKNDVSIHNSMDVGWLDSMDTPEKQKSKNQEKENAKESVITNQGKKKLIEDYDNENLEGLKFYTIPHDDMWIYCQHIDFHSIGRIYIVDFLYFLMFCVNLINPKVKETDFTEINKYMYRLFKEFDMEMNCFVQTTDGFKRTQKQETMIRTNCLDCLDRTNAVQAKLGFLAYINVMEDLENLKFHKR